MQFEEEFPEVPSYKEERRVYDPFITKTFLKSA